MSGTNMTFSPRRIPWRGHLVALALAWMAATVVAETRKPPITVVAEPTATTLDLKSDVTIKLTITNNGRGTVSFWICPGFYSVEIKDSQGMLVPKPEPPLVKDGELLAPPDPVAYLPLCNRNILVTLDPGKSWIEPVSIGRFASLKSPGSYTGRIILKAGIVIDGEVPSNLFRFTILEKPKS